MASLRRQVLAVLLVLCARGAASEPRTVADVPMLRWGASPAVEVTVNGQGPFKFAVDTCAGTTVVTPELVERLNLPGGRDLQASDGSGRQVTVKQAKIARIALGELEFKDVGAMVGPLRGPAGAATHEPIDGVLGFPLFRDYLLSFDFPGARVQVKRGLLAAADGKERLAWRSEYGLPLITVKIGETPLEVHLDTGNRGKAGLLLPAEVVAGLAKAGEPALAGKARSVTGEFEVLEVRLRDTLRIGGHEFPAPLARYSSHGLRPNVGAAMFHDFVVTLDQKNRVVELRRSSAAGS